MSIPEPLETEQAPERPVEKAFEAKPEHYIQGAEMLENPPDHSFVHGLQTFIAWVKVLLAGDK